MISIISLRHNQSTGLLADPLWRGWRLAGKQEMQIQYGTCHSDFSPTFTLVRNKNRINTLCLPSHFSLCFRSHWRKCDDSPLDKGCTISVFTSTKPMCSSSQTWIYSLQELPKPYMTNRYLILQNFYKLPLYSTKRSKGMEVGFQNTLKVTFSMLTTLISLYECYILAHIKRSNYKISFNLILLINAVSVIFFDDFLKLWEGNTWMI